MPVHTCGRFIWSRNGAVIKAQAPPYCNLSDSIQNCQKKKIMACSIRLRMKEGTLPRRCVHKPERGCPTNTNNVLIDHKKCNEFSIGIFKKCSCV